MSTLMQRFAKLKELRPEITKADLARATGAKPPSVGAWFDGGTLSMKGGTAAKAAALYGVSSHWLATGEGEMMKATHHPTNMGADEGENTVKMLSLPAAKADKTDVVISQYETGGAMGHGLVLQDQPGIIKEWRVSDDWLRLNVPHFTSKRNLTIVTGFGSSMKPMFNPGDPLLVDKGVRTIDHEGVYFFRVGDEGYIKMVQRVPEFDGSGFVFRIISKNSDYPPYDISPKNPHFEVLGKVLTVWRSEQH